MLSAAAKTCPPEGGTDGQRALIQCIQLATRAENVEGQTFDMFLSHAIATLRDLAATVLQHDSKIKRTIEDVEASTPRDTIGEMYSQLVQLVSNAYADALGENIDVPLERTVRMTPPKDAPFDLCGHVPQTRTAVMLVLYLADFDLKSLALLPRVLAHELVCHVGARHTDLWEQPPTPECRQFFSDGFMDCIAWRLLLIWLDTGDIPSATVVGHLEETEVPYAYHRPEIFSAGRGAWGNCRAAAVRLGSVSRNSNATDSARNRAAAEYAALEAAMRLNASVSSIRPKDRFALSARTAETAATTRFAELVSGHATPGQLLEDYDS